MAKVKDSFEEFKGKQRLTENELKLLLRRLNDGKIKVSQLRRGGYALTAEQVEKGRKWLMNLWQTPRGVERKNNPFGYREQAVLESFKTIRMLDVYDAARYGQRPYYIPLFEAIGKAGDSFQYYVWGGEINIVG